MTASRRSCSTTALALNTACPPRRSFVASDARHRGQAYAAQDQTSTAFGAALTTPAMFAGMDNARRFTAIVDD
jgi:hypothetical protein